MVSETSDEEDELSSSEVEAGTGEDELGSSEVEAGTAEEELGAGEAVCIPWAFWAPVLPAEKFWWADMDSMLQRVRPSDSFLSLISYLKIERDRT
jgi:hypothetical protein